MPTIELICDPDYLNQKLLSYLTNKENVGKSLNRKFSYAASYEDFIKIIKSSNNIDEIKQIQNKIMNEIMQVNQNFLLCIEIELEVDLYKRQQ